MMAKGSRKQLARSEKDDGGCMWGLISLFDFRQGHSSRKLLSDPKHERISRYLRNKFLLLRHFEEKNEDNNYDAYREDGKTNLGVTSVKSLVEEEMSKQHMLEKDPSDNVETILSKLEYILEKNKKKDENYKVDMDLLNDSNTANSDSHQPYCSNQPERALFNFDLAAFIVNFLGCNTQPAEKHLNCSTITGSCSSAASSTEHEAELVEKLCSIRKALNDVAEAFVSQKFTDTKEATNKAAIYHSKQFIKALETLDKNRELFLTLIQDPNSSMLKKMLFLQNINVESCPCMKGGDICREKVGSSSQSEDSIIHGLLHKQNLHNISSKEKSNEKNPPKESNKNNKGLSRIVVLKPTTTRTPTSLVSTVTPSSSPVSLYGSKHQEISERFGSYFSLKEIKQWLKHAIGDGKRGRHLISVDGVLHKIPYWYKDLGDINEEKNMGGDVPCNSFSNGSQTTTKSSVIAMIRDKLKIRRGNASFKVGDQTKKNMETAGCGLHEDCFFNQEAKKHLIEMINTTVVEKGTLQMCQALESLERFVSLPQLSPRFSPGREKETELLPLHIILAPKNHFEEDNVANNLSPMKLKCTNSHQEAELQVTDTRPAGPETNKQELNCSEVKLKSDQKGSIENMDMTTTRQIEENDHFGVVCESNDTKLDVTNEKCEEEEFGLGFSKEIPAGAPLSIPSIPSSLLINNEENPESIIDKPERPSPISVLEPIFLEDMISPGSPSAEQNMPECDAKLSICLDDKEIRDEFIRTVLEASGLGCNEVSERCHSLDQLVEPTLLEELGTSYGQLTYDSQLLFDCIKEVLVQIHRIRFCRVYWMSSLRHHLWLSWKDRGFVEEVSRAVDWHLKGELPTTLDQLVGKDIERGNWIDIQLENENIVVEMGDDLFEHLMEETILGLWI